MHYITFLHESPFFPHLLHNNLMFAICLVMLDEINFEILNFFRILYRIEAVVADLLISTNGY